MKISIKLVCLAISILTLSSGCTKKNTKKTNADAANRAKVQKDLRDKPVSTDGKQDPSTPAPVPAPSAAAPAITPDPTPQADPPKATPTPADNPSNNVASASGNTVVASPQANPAVTSDVKSDIEIYEKCITEHITSNLNSEKSQGSKSITPLKLLEIKTSTNQKCTKPSIAADQVEDLLVDTIVDIATKLFPESEEEIAVFELSGLEDVEPKKNYENYKAQPSTTLVNTAAGVSPSPTPVPPSVSPVTTSPPAPDNKPTTPPPTSSENTGVATQNNPSTPATPSAAAASATDGADMKALATQIKECFDMRVNAFARQYKSSGNTVVTPKALYDIHTSANQICSRAILKDTDKKIDAQMTASLVAIMNKEFPQSAMAIKFYAETETKNLPSENKKKLYADYQTPTAVSPGAKPDKIVQSSGSVTTTPAAKASPASPAAKADAQQLKPQEVKDIPAYEKCLNGLLPKVIKQAKAEVKEIYSPIYIAQFATILQKYCIIKESPESIAVLHKTLSKDFVAAYPNSKNIMNYYLAVEKEKDLDQDKRLNMYLFYNVGVAIQATNVSILGKIDAAQSTANLVTYTLTKITGQMKARVQPVAAEPSIKNMTLEQMPIPNARFVFDFTLKANRTGTLSVIEGQNTFPLDFTVMDGTTDKIRAGQKVKIALTPESWAKVIETQLRLNITMDLKIDPSIPLKFSHTQKEAHHTRICELSNQNLNCADPDISAQMLVDIEKLKKSN
ncbi:MAG: hypothetical protein JNL11_13755 [Bdellovibrionaceae bacterium]|nr:hypothetical protein [Pseudobdellovibrionaceae bacterium]